MHPPLERFPTLVSSEDGGLSAGRDGWQRGFTLMELMVAIAISSLLLVLITVVSTQAQRIASETQASVEVATKARVALDDIKSTFERAVPTDSLEFSIDQEGAFGLNERWDEGEEITGEYREVNLIGGRAGEYDESTQIIERWYETEQYGLVTRHANYSLYFKAPIEVGGDVRVANIEYFLSNPVERLAERDQGREPLGKILDREVDDAGDGFELVRSVTWIDIGTENFNTSDVPLKRQLSVLCSNVTDLKVDYFFNPADGRPGRFVSPSQERDVAGGAQSEQPLVTVSGGGLMKEFVFGGFKQTLSGTMTKARRNYDRSEYVPPYFTIGRRAFSELGVGDQIYLWSRSQQNAVEGEFVIQRKEPDKLYFEKSPAGITEWDADRGGIRYRAGYLPSAIQVSIRVLNNDATKPRSYTIVIQPSSKRPSS